MHWNRTTAVDGTSEISGSTPDRARPPRVPLHRTGRALVELARHRHSLDHLPTRAQVRELARWQGRAPSSLRLDASVLTPGELPRGLESELGRHGLCFTTSLRGVTRELVMLPRGGGFARTSGLP